MNIRIQQFLAAENISQSQLADTLGVARASISHVVAGRNKPSFDFIESMSRNYPELNLDWLITGNGKMYKQQGSSPAAYQPVPVPAQQPETTIAEPSQTPIQEIIPLADPIPAATENKPNAEHSIGNKSRKISKIVVFYDDNTFQEIL
ncbi:MAG: helix-turn-helix transcriptional regulator [Bacteroidales bacterium]|nr:helix-turn-helix transcriptional regulator [Bacteroidales bacterium]